jgi:hypothetical protein
MGAQMGHLYKTKIIDISQEKMCMVGILQWIDPEGSRRETAINYFNRFVDDNPKLISRY